MKNTQPLDKGICDICDISSRLQHLNRHLEVHDSMFENEKCDLCPKTFDRKDNLKRHVKNVHELMVDDQIVLVKEVV